MATLISEPCAGCGKFPAPMMCPTCVEKGLPPTYFCEQSCFKSAWKTHKKKHSAPPPAPSFDSMSEQDLRSFPFTGSIRPHKLSARRVVPQRIPKPEYADTGRPLNEEVERRSIRWEHYSDEEIAGIRRTCELAREVLNVGLAAVKLGVTTDEIDRVVHEASIERGGYPSPLNYHNFPKSVCTSINEVICHGIPDGRPLEDGDIINLDVTLFHNGFHGDLNETCFVGKPNDESVKLVTSTWEALVAALGGARPGALFREFGHNIAKTVEPRGLSVVRTYVGHGIGRLFHCKPDVPHYARNKAPGTMTPGMIFTVEPMINAGHYDDELWPDGWTAVTRDGKRSAQFEHQVLITKGGCDVLSARTQHKQWLPYFYDQLDTLGINENAALSRALDTPRAYLPGAPAAESASAPADAGTTSIGASVSPTAVADPSQVPSS
eukprot:TRINITY_DN2661_c0_g5_i2.p1 TRINITY_DN2661_c0_g5~~TRINITY_DN2661_c0_g5_i2.p1  ORF type:complete len:436 (-),score=76.88 TRINITY_DN2661_c0_g5_i2:186-1493(-)